MLRHSTLATILRIQRPDQADPYAKPAFQTPQPAEQWTMVSSCCCCCCCAWHGAVHHWRLHVAFCSRCPEYKICASCSTPSSKTEYSLHQWAPQALKTYVVLHRRTATGHTLASSRSTLPARPGWSPLRSPSSQGPRRAQQPISSPSSWKVSRTDWPCGDLLADFVFAQLLLPARPVTGAAHQASDCNVHWTRDYDRDCFAASAVQRNLARTRPGSSWWR